MRGTTGCGDDMQHGGFVYNEQFGPTQLVTQTEAAAILHVDHATVARLADSGEIWSVRLMGGERRYRGPQLRALGATTIPQQRHPTR